MHYFPGLVLAAALTTYAGDSTAEPRSETRPETRLVQALDAFQAGETESAYLALEQLVRERPNFRLAQLVYADLLRARAGAPQALAVQSGHVRLQQLVEEARFRLQHSEQAARVGQAPSAILKLAPGAQAVLADLAGARLYLMQGDAQGVPRVHQHYYAGIGVAGVGKQVEGDGKTPVGIYRITGFKDDAELTDFYGAGAFVLSYPNRLDLGHRRSGSGIWIHGVPPDTYTRAPRSSRGCVTLANEDLAELRGLLGENPALVLLSGDLRWQEPGQHQSAVHALEEAIEHWRLDWESRDLERLLRHYAEDYWDERGDRGAFAAHKRRVNATKRMIQVRLDQLSLYAYPGEADLFVARFRQDYQSDNYRSEDVKEQLWRRRGERWEIVAEGGDALKGFEEPPPVAAPAVAPPEREKPAT